MTTPPSRRPTPTYRQDFAEQLVKAQLAWLRHILGIIFTGVIGWVCVTSHSPSRVIWVDVVFALFLAGAIYAYWVHTDVMDARRERAERAAL